MYLYRVGGDCGWARVPVVVTLLFVVCLCVWSTMLSDNGIDTKDTKTLTLSIMRLSLLTPLRFQSEFW